MRTLYLVEELHWPGKNGTWFVHIADGRHGPMQGELTTSSISGALILTSREQAEAVKKQMMTNLPSRKYEVVEFGEVTEPHHTPESTELKRRLDPDL